MKIALIGDVHGNLPALEAVLDDARRRGVEAIWNVGDFVGYGPFPDEVVHRLRQERAVSIAGNYDLKALSRQWPKKPHKRLAFQWAYDHLSPASRDYLTQLPREIRLEVQGLKILLTHGSPASNEEHLVFDTPAPRLAELAAMAKADIVVVGHSHLAFVRKAGDTTFINTGSVGRQDDGDWRAAYAILTVADGRFTVRHYRLAYDVQRAAEEIRRQELPEEFAQMLLQGRDLSSVQAGQEGAVPGPAARDAALSARGAKPDNQPAATTEPSASPALQSRAPGDKAAIESALQLARESHYDQAHTLQVTALALRLFDQLRPLHQLGDEDRFILQCAGLLHDIGWAEGRKGHHKTAMRMILESTDLRMPDEQRTLAALVARYHRKALPKKKHRPYGSLGKADQLRVSKLAALLRVADGLDATHNEAVSDVACQVAPREVIITCQAPPSAQAERRTALKKGDLFEQVFQRELKIVIAS